MLSRFFLFADLLWYSTIIAMISKYINICSLNCILLRKSFLFVWRKAIFLITHFAVWCNCELVNYNTKEPHHLDRLCEMIFNGCSKSNLFNAAKTTNNLKVSLLLFVELYLCAKSFYFVWRRTSSLLNHSSALCKR